MKISTVFAGLAMRNSPSVRGISTVNMWGYGLGGIVVSAGLMGRMSCFYTVGIL